MKLLFGGETIYCFFLSYSGPPNLIDNLPVVAVEGSTNTVNLSQDPDAFPFPQQFSWTGSVLPANDSRRSFDYPNVTFQQIERGDAGTYTLTATNYRLDNTSVLVGTDTGSFTVDVQCKLISLSQVSDWLSVQSCGRRKAWYLSSCEMS